MSTAASTYRTMARWLLAFLMLATVGVLFVEMGLGWDFANFYDAGRKIVAGEVGNLYNAQVLIAGQPGQGQMEFAATPLSALFYVPLALFSPRVAMFLFKLQNSLMYLAGLWLLYRHCRRYIEPTEIKQARFVALFALMLVVYQPLWTVYRVGGQTTPTVFLLLMVGWLLHQRGALWGSAAIMVLVVTIKPVFVTMLALLMVISGLAFLVRSVVLGLGAGLLSIAVMGWPIHQRFLDVMLLLSGQSTAWAFNSAVTVPVESVHLAWDPAVTVASTANLVAAVLIVRLAVFGLFAWLVVRSRREGWDAVVCRHFDWAIAIMFCLMVAPIVWEHYLVLLFIPLVFLVANEDRIPRPALHLVLSAVALGVFQNLVVVLWLWNRLIGAPWPVHVGVAFVKAAPLLLTGVLLVKYRRSVFASFAFEPPSLSGKPIAPGHRLTTD